MKWDNMGIPDSQIEHIQEWPGYDVVTLATDSNGFVNLWDDMNLTNSKGLGNWKIGSVMSYALKSNECPIAAYEREKSLGFDVYYIIGLGTCISAHKQPKTARVAIHKGMKINFQGKQFTIEPANNDNWSLKEIIN